MSRDWDTVFYLSVHDLDGGHVFSQADRLLEALKREHGEPRYDVPPQLETRNGRKTTASPRH